jgi:D-lactate dehydrogenase
MKIVFFDVEESDKALVLARFPHAAFLPAKTSEAEIQAVCANAEVVSVFITTTITKDLLALMPKVKLMCTRSVGFDHVDLEACGQRGITVCNVPDYGSHVIAEHVFALLLGTLRHIHLGDKRVREGHFDYHGLRGFALKGKTIGIVGTGKIGARVARIARGFGMNILAMDQCKNLELESDVGVRYVSLEELFKQSDVITLHVPATKDTEHMIDTETLDMMKDGVVLVNTARGSLIDSSSLLSALNKGKVAYALLDVLEHEQNFEENKKLVKHRSVVTTPHIAFYADDSMRNMYLDCLQSIEEWQSGVTPQHIVRPLNIVCDLPPTSRS